MNTAHIAMYLLGQLAYEGMLCTGYVDTVISRTGYAILCTWYTYAVSSHITRTEQGIVQATNNPLGSTGRSTGRPNENTLITVIVQCYPHASGGCSNQRASLH